MHCNLLNAILHGANTAAVPAAIGLVATILHNSVYTWLTIYLNHVQMTHLFYFSENSANYRYHPPREQEIYYWLNFLNHRCGIPEIQ